MLAGAAAKKRRVAAQGSCDAKSKNCKPDVEGLADGLSKLALGAAGDSDAEKDRKLGEALRAVEAKYLAAELTPTQKAKPGEIAETLFMYLIKITRNDNGSYLKSDTITHYLRTTTPNPKPRTLFSKSTI